ncbi:hypothetical protein MINS_42810 [Mycolicibacterium insubricum]|nr:hypothetical protein MINS_42810 [Mycolicibacterium insubricum]
MIEPIAVADEPATSAVTVSSGTGRRPANRARVLALAAVLAVALAGALTAAVALLTANQRDVDRVAARQQRFVDGATQVVVNMFSYTPDSIDASVNRFVTSTSGPLRAQLDQANNVDNLKALFRDTNATSEVVIKGAALEDIDEATDNASVLVAARVTVTDIDGVNKPSQAYRLRVIVHEDADGVMTGYDLKYPDGGN